MVLEVVKENVVLLLFSVHFAFFLQNHRISSTDLDLVTLYSINSAAPEE